MFISVGSESWEFKVFILFDNLYFLTIYTSFYLVNDITPKVNTHVLSVGGIEFKRVILTSCCKVVDYRTV